MKETLTKEKQIGQAGSNKKSVIRKSKFLRLIIAGTLGTLAFYAAAYVDIAVTGVPLDITMVLGQLIAGEHPAAQLVGHAAHIANGLGLALFFGYVFLPISTRIMKGRLWLHGIAFGVMVTVTTVWFGLLPALGAGVAGLEMAALIPVMTITRHIAYGAVLGLLVKQK